MADGNGDSGGRTGPWDVVLYVVKRSPILAAAVLLLGAGIQGAKIVLDEKNKAQQELLVARAQIQAERQKSRSDIEAERQASRAAIAAEQERARRAIDMQQQNAATAVERAAERERLANEKMTAAEKRVAQAETDALKKAQDYVSETSSRVQQLVLGQLQSMEDLDRLRLVAAEELKAQQERQENELKDLAKQRVAILEKLADAERKIRIAQVQVYVSELKGNLKDQPYLVGSTLKKIVAAMEVEGGPDEIERTIAGSKEPKLRGTLQYALALQSGKPEPARQFGASLTQFTGLFDPDWFPALFDCCDETTEALWAAVLPAAARLVADGATPAADRFELAEFFDKQPKGWLRTLFFDRSNAENEDLWRALNFLVEVVRGNHPKLSTGQRTRALDLIFAFDLAAAHVWTQWLNTESGLSADVKAEALSSLKYWKGDYPVVGTAPSPTLVAFWTARDLVARRSEYAARGTSDAYRDVRAKGR